MFTILILGLAIICIVGYSNKNLNWFSLPFAIVVFIIGAFLIVIFRDLMVWLIYITGIIAILFVILLIITKVKE